MPGVNIQTAVRQGPAARATAPGVRYFVAGLTERGRVDAPVLLRSMADYQAAYGDRVSYGTLYDDLRCHFEEGGVDVAVIRVVGPGATVGTFTLNDTAGTPKPTLRIDASSVGPWSSRVSVAVTAGTVTNTFTITVYLDGTAVEVYANLATPAAAQIALAASTYVRATDLASTSTVPTNNPAVLAITPLTSGTDVRGSVTATTLLTALSLFSVDLGAGAVAIPGYTSALVGAGLLAHAQAYNRVALTSVAPASTAAQAKTAAAALIPAGAGGEYGGLFFPSLIIPDGQITRTVGPEGFVAAARAKAINTTGAWRAPGGEIGKAVFAVGTDVYIDRPTGDDLDLNKVNAIRVIAGAPRLYGWRPLSSDSINYPLLSTRDLINVIQVAAANLLESFVYAIVDANGQTISRLQGALVGLIEPIAAAGGLYPRYDDAGNLLDPGYVVDTSAAVNTTATIAAGQLRAQLGLRPSPTASVINLTIVKAALTAQL